MVFFNRPQSLSNLRSLWARLAQEQKLRQFRKLPVHDAERLFSRLNPGQQADVLISLSASEQRMLLRRLPADELADLMQALPEAQRAACYTLLESSVQEQVHRLEDYPRDKAGGLMNPQFTAVRISMSTEDALNSIRKQARNLHQDISYAYVLDEQDRLVGVLSLRELLAAEAELEIRELMEMDLVAIRDTVDQERIGQIITDYSLDALPVVDAQERMIGIIAIEDVLPVLQQEASEDIYKLGGTGFLSETYMEVPTKTLLGKRATWLAVLFIGEMLTATAMGFFEGEIAKATVLAVFVPLIISSGGNSGSQASTLVVRSIALGEIELKDWIKVFAREAVSGLVLGGLLACIGLLRILLWQFAGKAYGFNTYGQHYLLIALTVAGSLIGVVLFGTLAGSMLPFLLKSLRMDPATASAPMVATLVDVTGLVIYFTLAKLMLSGTLL